MPTSTNNPGHALGGAVLHWMDIRGAIATRRFSRGQVVAAAMDHVDFHAPIDLGDIVVLTGDVFDAGDTSMAVCVDLRVERPSEGETRRAASASVTDVAIDEEGDNRPVPALDCPIARERDLRERALDASGVASV